MTIYHFQTRHHVICYSSSQSTEQPKYQGHALKSDLGLHLYFVFTHFFGVSGSGIQRENKG